MEGVSSYSQFDVKHYQINFLTDHNKCSEESIITSLSNTIDLAQYK